MATEIKNDAGIACYQECIVNTNSQSLNVRSSPEMGNNIKGSLSKGTPVNVYKVEGNWKQIYGGNLANCWVSAQYLKVNNTVPINGGSNASTDQTPASTDGWNRATSDAELSSNYVNHGHDNFNEFNGEVYETIMKLNQYRENDNEMIDVTSDEYAKLQNQMWKEYNNSISLIDQLIGNMGSYFNSDPQLNMISGMPPQFNDMADPRMMDTNEKPMYTGLHAYGDGIGRMFQHYIAEDIPLVLIKPGKPVFMPSVNIFDRTKISKAVRQKLWDGDEQEGFADAIKNKSLEDIFSEYDTYNDTRYYGFKPDYDTYCKYVNTMCRHTAVKMGLSSYSNFNISSADGYGLKNFVMRNSLGFFYDKEGTSQSDQSSNTTGESALSGTLKTAGSVVREAQFIFGSGEAAHRGSEAEAKYQAEMENLMGTVKTDPSSFFGRIKNSGKTLFNGGNLIFPDIWQDSAYSKSYNLSFKLFTPYGDPESIFRDIYVPFYSLLALSLPRQITAQGYSSPFILKMSTPGWFNSDMCMITSFSFSKGDNDGWTKDGFPLSINVSIGLNDLYSVLMMSTDKHARILSNNTGLIEFMDSMAGITFNDYDPWRQLEQTLAARWNVIGDIPYSIQNKMVSAMDNVANKVNRFLFR